MLEIIAGWDPREDEGYEVAYFSAVRRTSIPIPRPTKLLLSALRYNGLYTRPYECRGREMWDIISDAPMTTEFSNTRFLVPWLAREQWVLVMDFCDQLFQADPAELFSLRDDRYAVMVVKREHIAQETQKMDGQTQTNYPRKNWSSVILWNRDHKANERLTLQMVNELPGRDLHRFCWLNDDEIGELPPEWNHLVGIDHVRNGTPPKLLHYTRGAPFMAGYEDGPWADEWKREDAIMRATKWAIGQS